MLFEFNDIKKSSETSYNFRILLNIPKGKKFVNEPDKIFNLSAQKGGTCNYYSYSLLRPHFGKFFPPLNIRRKEQIFSAFRRELTQLTLRQSSFNDFQKSIQEALQCEEIKQDNLEIVYAIIENTKLLHCRNVSDANLLNSFENYCKTFEKSDARNLKTYLDNDFELTYVELCKLTLTELGLDPYKTIYLEYKLHKHNLNPSDKIKNSDIEKIFEASPNIKAGYSLHAVFRQMRENFGLSVTTWKKQTITDNDSKNSMEQNDGPEGIYNLLNSGAPLEAGGMFKRSIFKKHIIAKTTYGSWNIAIIENFEIDINKEMKLQNHSIVILGIEKNEAGCFVYYYNPQDGLSPTHHTLYKIPYSLFEKCLTDIYNEFENPNGPFLVQGNIQYFKKMASSPEIPFDKSEIFLSKNEIKFNL